MSTTTKTVYKIKRADGQFSLGGSWPRFGKEGKIWKRKGDLTSHLRIVRRDMYSDCKIIEYELVEKSECTDTISIGQWLNEIEERKRSEQESRERFQEKQAKKVRRKAFLKLREEFGDELDD